MSYQFTKYLVGLAVDPGGSPMASRQSSRRTVPEDRPAARTLGLEEAGDDAFEALRSETARSLLSTLYDSPAAVSTLADRLGTSPQNVGYHLDNLEDAGLVEVIDTRTSRKGVEMDVYGPSAESLLVVIGGTDAARDCRAAIEALTDAPGS